MTRSVSSPLELHLRAHVEIVYTFIRHFFLIKISFDESKKLMTIKKMSVNIQYTSQITHVSLELVFQLKNIYIFLIIICFLSLFDLPVTCAATS